MGESDENMAVPSEVSGEEETSLKPFRGRNKEGYIQSE